jgi:signal transduction histidine kinase
LSGNLLTQWQEATGRFLPSDPDQPKFFFGSDAFGSLGGFWGVDKATLHRFARGRLASWTGLPSVNIHAVAEDRRGDVWAATRDAGPARIRDGKVAQVYSSSDGLPSNLLWFISGSELKIACADRNRNLHVFGLDPWAKRAVLRPPPSLLERLDINQPYLDITALYEDRDGILWIGSYDGGLGRFKDGRFTRYTTKEGLFDDGVFQILEDGRGVFWMSCNRGIYRVNKHELNEFAAGRIASITSIAYGRSDGMLNLECNGGRWPAGVKTRDGKLWFPTQDGVVVIDPEAIPFNAQPPPVVIESFLLDRAPVAPLNLDRPVRIAPGWENFEIQYTALSFINSERLKFRYKLEGLDQDWTDAGKRRTAYYSYVPPGQYVFRVVAANSDGVGNTEGQSLRVIVLPPFYRTWWFIALAAMGSAGLLWFVWRHRVAQFRRAQAAQQAFSRQLIESQEGERKRIAGELHDGLGQRLVVIKNLALMVLNSPLKNGEALEQIEEISAEASQTIGEVKAISYNLRPYQLDRISLTKAIEAIVRTAQSASEIIFKAEIDDIDGVFPKDLEINFYRVVQEGVNNILKHSQATEAGVTIRRDPEGLRLTIRDNGKGFTPGPAKPDSPRAGLGLIGVSERAQLLGGKPVIHSAPGQGTIIGVKIALPDQAVRDDGR